MFQVVDRKGNLILYESEEFFQKALGFRLLKTLHFENRKQVKNWCSRCLKRERVAITEKWLGSLYRKEILEGFTADLMIRWIDRNIGYGVFANKPIRANSLIGEYTGLVRKRWTPLSQQISENYSFLYTGGNLDRSPYAIDAQYYGNITRFINHSDNPNCRPGAVWVDGFFHILILSEKEIAAGEQLTYDYGEAYWENKNLIKVDM